MAQAFYRTWMEENRPDPAIPDLVVLREKKKARSAVENAIRQAALDHLVGLEIIEQMGDYPETLAFIRNKLPTEKRVMSGDLGEILASEFIDQCMQFAVPIKRLRWKDDRNTTMRGNDVIAVCQRKNRCALLKAESKSRANVQDVVIVEAVTALEKHSGRPNPSSLAFISARLREQGRDNEAVLFERVQSNPPQKKDIEHLVFTFSGNDSTKHLKKHSVSKKGGIRRHLVGCVVPDHQAFIKQTFERLHAGNTR